MKKSNDNLKEKFCFSRNYITGTMSKSKEFSVDLVNLANGKRYPIVNSDGHFINFPGIENFGVIEPYYKGTKVEPVVYFSSSFEVTSEGKYMVIWELQPDGRYWADENDFGGTSDYEIYLYSYLDEEGRFTAPFKVYSIANVKYFGTDLEETAQKKYDERKADERRRKKSGESDEDSLRSLIDKACDVVAEMFCHNSKQCFACFDVPSRPYEAFVTIAGNWRIRIDMKVIYTDRLFSRYIKSGDHDKAWILEQLKLPEIREEIFQNMTALLERIDND